MISGNCNFCNKILNENNRARNGIRNGKMRFRNECKPCNSKRVIKNASKDVSRRRAKATLYLRKSGRVKMYPCERCKNPCYKKYKRAFCTDMCRFMSYVTITDSCWIWIGAKNKRGYGLFSFRNKKSITTHRVSYILYRGEIPEGKLICHTCDNPSCINPQHLWAGTTQQNTRDMVIKGRSLRGEKQNGAKLTEQDVIKIRKLNKEGIQQNKIAEMFNVFAGHINNIIKRRVWKHI